ncbi:hypothetical protein LIER_36572 [Lithospermum erythrorhizon]|uniref:ATP-dependent DNA helicase n=1 Tax=Lithospermum erythrorhizon TaxID=34254 RepID=A0AAV3PBN2_LITER
MAEDFKKVQGGLGLSENDIMFKFLQRINDTLESLGRNINEFHLVSFKFATSESECYIREIIAERNIPVPEEDLHEINVLNKEQKEAYDIIYNNEMTNKGGLYFVDGAGGTGKSFLYKVLLAHSRSKGFTTLIVASSDIAYSGFIGGRTAHSRFKIPIDGGPNKRCQISFQSSESDLISTSKIIIWDEAPMADKYAMHALYKLLQDLCENQDPFGGKLVVFGGDFHQVLPVVRGGGNNEQIEASIMSSPLREHFVKLKLTVNMRARFDPGFVDFLMRIGNGQEPTNSRNEIQILKPMLVRYTTIEESVEQLIKYVYPDINLFERNPFEMMQHVILCPKNEFVDDINSKLINRIPGEEVIYISDDRAKSRADQGDYIEYLNNLEPKGLPQHKLVLKKNSPVILLRNINPVEGLCNGTRLICKQLTPNVVDYALAMIINKAQGQTLDCVGIYLRQPVFTHGQLYVALSRAKTGDKVRLLVVPPTCNDPRTEYTTNVVYDEVLVKASCV